MQVTLNTDRVSIIVGESLATLRRFADKSFDIVVTDPPYSPHVHEHFGKERRNDGGHIHDPLNFPPMTPDLIELYAYEYVRLCKGWILSFTDFFNSYLWGTALERAGGAWVRTGQWVKTNPKPQMTGDRPACGAEDIVIGHASPDTVAGRRLWEWNGRGHAAIWRGPRDGTGSNQHDGNAGELHPNQKPEWLLQALLGMFAPAGALCLDPFLGSGTTAVAALRTEPVPGEVALETGCTKCLRALAQKYAPPLPIGVRVVGIEGNLEYAQGAARRVLDVHGFQHAA